MKMVIFKLDQFPEDCNCVLQQSHMQMNLKDFTEILANRIQHSESSEVRQSTGNIVKAREQNKNNKSQNERLCKSEHTEHYSTFVIDQDTLSVI